MMYVNIRVLEPDEAPTPDAGLSLWDGEFASLPDVGEAVYSRGWHRVVARRFYCNHGQTGRPEAAGAVLLVSPVDEEVVK